MICFHLLALTAAVRTNESPGIKREQARGHPLTALTLPPAFYWRSVIGFEETMVLAGVIMVIMVPVVILVAASQKQQAGRVKCRRCGHVGETSSKRVPFKGVEQVCAACGSADWRKMKERGSEHEVECDSGPARLLETRGRGGSSR